MTNKELREWANYPGLGGDDFRLSVLRILDEHQRMKTALKEIEQHGWKSAPSHVLARDVLATLQPDTED